MFRNNFEVAVLPIFNSNAVSKIVLHVIYLFIYIYIYQIINFFSLGHIDYR